MSSIGGGSRPDLSKLAPKTALAARAAGITNFQMVMSDVLLSMIFSGVLERHPTLKVVIGEAGIGWIPYVLNRMDAEWEEQLQELVEEALAFRARADMLHVSFDQPFFFRCLQRP